MNLNSPTNNAITKITMENFQSHKKTVIEPAPAGGLTVIVGPTDSGKSAIFRALRWLFYNQPQGMEFVRTGATFARVTIEYESGHKVIRERTVSTNRYKIVYPGAESPEVFEGFGNGVPLEVQEITGVRSVKIGDDTYYLNIAEQLDGPFLGVKQISSPARAKVLGKLAGTEEIDLAGQEVGTDLYRRNQDEKRLGKEIAGLKEQIKQYDYLPALKETIEQLQQILDATKAAQERKTKLENLRFSLATITQNITQCDQVIERWKDLNAAALLVAGVENAKQRRDSLINLRHQKETAEAGIRDAEITISRFMYLPEVEDMVVMVETLSPQLKALKDAKMALVKIRTLQSGADLVLNRWAKLGEMERARDQVVELAERKRILIGLRQQLQTAEENIVTARQNVVVWEQRVAELEGAYRDALLAAGVCPTCGSEVTEEVLQRAV